MLAHLWELPHPVWQMIAANLVEAATSKMFVTSHQIKRCYVAKHHDLNSDWL
jgi:hypothetical protein